MIHNLSENNSILSQFIANLRDVQKQADRAEFRQNLNRVGQFMAFEISKSLNYELKEVETPLGLASCNILTDQIVSACILRAGLPLHNGILNIFDQAENAFISSSRIHHKDGSFDIKSEMVSSPEMDDKVLILTDAVIATGASMVQALEAILEYGKPKSIHIVACICATDGLDQITRLFPKAHIWIGAEDEELTAKSYVVPGLGNAGDLSYGEKVRD